MSEETQSELEEQAAALRRDAYLIGEFWDALHGSHIPESLAEAIIASWYSNCVPPLDFSSDE